MSPKKIASNMVGAQMLLALISRDGFAAVESRRSRSSRIGFRKQPPTIPYSLRSTRKPVTRGIPTYRRAT
jgi:hypothetical protein